MINPFDFLQSNLLDLLYELQGSGIRITVGGGYGLYLKRQQIEILNVATLLSFLLPARVTNDLDVFLQTQVIADLESAKAVSDALKRLECNVVETSKNFQFARDIQSGEQSYQVKFDFLTKMPIDLSETGQLEVKNIRVKNKKSGGVHARLTEEAIAVDDTPTAIQIAGTRTSGEDYTDTVYIPQVYPYLMMKLFAFRDYEAEKNAGQARKHALDLYSIIAMTTEEELATAEQLRQRYGQTTAAQEAGQIAREFFSQDTNLGIIRLRENQVAIPENEVTEFKSLLSDLFP